MPHCVLVVTQVVDPVLGALDPNNCRFTGGRLYRDCTTYRDGKYIKDISRLNRDLNAVVVVDDDPECVCDQPENAILVTRWEGDVEDTELLDLIPFLKGLDKNRKAGKVHDFREEIERYRQGGSLKEMVARYNQDLIQELKKDQEKEGRIRNLPGGRIMGAAKDAAKVNMYQKQKQQMEQFGKKPF